jgi:hypothetical protein
MTGWPTQEGEARDPQQDEGGERQQDEARRKS